MKKEIQLQMWFFLQKIKGMRDVNKNTVGVSCVLSTDVCVVAEVVVVVVVL